MLYHDTDSVIYYRKLTDPEINCGDYLGEFADEIIKNYGDGAKCRSFVSLGPKNYAYEVEKENGEVVSEIKAKGIQLTAIALKQISFSGMMEIGKKYSNEGENTQLDIPQRAFRINRNAQIFTKYFDKIYQAVCTKRVINGNITLPYGY